MAFPSLVGLDVDCEMGTVGFPTKPRFVALGYLNCMVVQGDFFDQVVLHVQLNESIVICDDVNVLLVRGD